MSLATESGKERIPVIDVARFFAMALVFYGHFVERFMLLKNPAGFAQYKFIYSSHMVTFFILAGYVIRESDITLGFGRYLKYRLVSRLLPFVFFTAIFMVPPLFFPGEFYGIRKPSVEGYITGLLNTLFGSGLTLFWVGCLMTLGSLAICMPFIYLFDKFVPQLVGKPRLSGPWFRNFI